MNSWDKKMNSEKERFGVLREFNKEEGLDGEKGLVWESSIMKKELLWQNARFVCEQKDLGGSGGWGLSAFNMNWTSVVDVVVVV